MVISIVSFGILFATVRFANGTKPSIYIRLDCYSHCLCLTMCGVTSLWILWRGFRVLEANLWCSLWWIDSPRAHFIALSHPYSAQSVARAFFESVVRLHGFPCSIVSDRDTIFTNSFWEELFRLAGVKLLRSSAFHPHTDGQSEVTNRIIVMYLVHGFSGYLGQSIVSTHLISLLSAPLLLKLYMAEHLLPYYLIRRGHLRSSWLISNFMTHDIFLQEIRERLLLAQDVTKENQNQKRRHMEFSVGDWVLLIAPLLVLLQLLHPSLCLASMDHIRSQSKLVLWHIVSSYLPRLASTASFMWPC